MKLMQWLLMVSVVCVFPAMCEPFVQAEEDENINYPNPDRWSQAAQHFEQWDSQNSYPENAVLFVGSSSIVGWSTAAAFPDFPVINRGFGGSVMAESVYYAERFILKYNPKVVVVYAGDNDCSLGIPPERIVRDFIQLADKIHAALPDTQIICLSVKRSKSRENLWPQMQRTNALYQQYAQTKDYITYVDVDVVLLADDRTPDPAYYLADRLHLSEKGYAAWNELMLPIIKERYALAGKK
jgi:lysophospholipase L1-like esterase